MKSIIYVVSPTERTSRPVEPATFAELEAKERQDLQAWIIDKPEVLGESLLLITTEFDRFDRSDRRLDLLLLDKQCTIVVAELKLDAQGTFADQQTIRYASFCSTMTMDDVVWYHSIASGMTKEQSGEAIRKFLDLPDLPELTREPRIILAAGSFQDQELTSTVMWLRKFGVDISCVELTPYRYPGDDHHILLVPRILIPLPEAEEYQVRVEKKEQSEIARQKDSRFFDLWHMVLEEYKALGPTLPGPQNPSRVDYMQLKFGNKHIHYEWCLRQRNKTVDVAIHFETAHRESSVALLEKTLEGLPDVGSAMPYPMESGAWGQKWAQLMFRIPYEGSMPDRSVASRTAQAMQILVDKTYSVVSLLK
jgi:hypothetical protein